MRESNRNVAGARSHQRLQNGLVIAETAVGLLLLAGSGLLIRSFVHVLQVDPGFDSRHVLTSSVSVPTQRDNRVQFYTRLLPTLAALPGVQSVAAGWPLPLSDSNIGVSFIIEGRPVPESDEPSEQLSVVTPDYFRALHVPVRAGREFTWRDTDKSAPVIIISEGFAKKYFPGENALGKRIKSDLKDGAVNAPMREVVGIVGDVKTRGLTGAAEPRYYLPWLQAVITNPTLVINTTGDATPLIGVVRSQVAAMDKTVPVYRAHMLQDDVSSASADPRFRTLLVTSFAAIALLLAGVGLYGVLAYMVTQRSSEIGVRMALGAQRGDVIIWVLRRGLCMTAAGLGIGFLLAVFLMGLIAKLLFGVEPLDPGTFLTVAAVMILASLVASIAPAYRAARLDPMTALREQ